MFKTDKIERLVRYVIISGFMKRDIAPLSLMLVAPPESNKTSILKQFESVRNVKYTVDLSSKPLVEFIKQASKDKMYHLVIPDFIKVVSHNANTVSSLVATLNAAIEEGIQRSMFYGQEVNLEKNTKIGLITSITPRLYNQQFRHWNDIGFLSRFLTVSYKYSDETRSAIMKMIGGNGDDGLDFSVERIRKVGQKEIMINSDISSAIQLFTEDMVQKLRTYKVKVYRGDSYFFVGLDIQGFRLLKQLRLLAQCIAFDRKLDEVNYECVAELKDLITYITMPDNPKEL